MIAKITISGVVLFAATVGLAAPASANPLFDQFSCTCGPRPNLPTPHRRIESPKASWTPKPGSCHNDRRRLPGRVTELSLCRGAAR